MPAEKSLQKKLARVRPPRVQIEYDVEINGSEIKKELPFVLGVMADLAGHPDPDLDHEPLKDRDFAEINRDTFGGVMTAMKPRLAFSVDNRVEKDGSKLGVVLNFKSIDDFEPENVVNQIEPLKKLLEARQALADLKTRVVSNDKLESVLKQVLQATEELKKKSKADATAGSATMAGTPASANDAVEA